MEIVLSEVGLAFVFGLAVCIVFFFINCFQYTLAPKTYDEALNELKSNDHPTQKGSGKKSKSKKVKLNGINDEDSDEVIEESLQMRSSLRRSSTAGQPRFKRTESIKNEHVVFADEIGPSNDRHAPGVGEEVVQEIEGILHNKADQINIDPHGDEKVKNAFEHIQPLDDLGLEIRRKSLQITPSGSQSGSHRGSRSDLNLIGRDSDDDHQKILRFAEAAAAASAPEDTFDCKKFSKTLRKSEMTIEEINTLIEILIRKEEQSQWVDSSGKKSILFQLRKETDDRKREVLEANELTNSLQAKLKQLRGEFTEEKATLLREKRDLEEAKANMQRELEALRLQRNTSIPASVEGEGSDRGSANNNDRWLQEIQELKAQLRDEKEENGALNQSVLEQQVVLKTALKQICPALGVEYCDEHQKWFESFVEKMKMNRGHT